MPIAISEQNAAAIRSAAHHVAAAGCEHERAEAALATATERANKVLARIGEKQARRQEITARRLAGDERPDDGAEIALLDADREGLAKLLADADATVRAMAQPAAEAAARKLGAQQMLEAAERAAEADAIAEHAIELETALAAAIRRLDELRGGPHNGRPKWAPARDTYTAIRRLAVQAGRV